MLPKVDLKCEGYDEHIIQYIILVDAREPRSQKSLLQPMIDINTGTFVSKRFRLRHKISNTK
jgi:hypothetical protein